MSTKPVITPADTLNTNDPGDDVQRRFRYQAGYAALVSLDLLDDNSEFEEMFCEHHEDTLVKRKDGTFSGIQVKTRLPGHEPFKSDDDQILNAISRFIEQDIEYSNCYSRFVLATNYTFWSGEKGNAKNLYHILDLARQIQVFKPQNLPPKFSGSIKKLIGNTNSKTTPIINADIVLSVLCKIELQQDLPKFDDIENRIIHNIFLFYDDASDAHYEDLGKAARALINKMLDASSLQHVAPKQAYFSLCSNPTQARVDAIIEGKRISKETVDKILCEALSNKVLLSKQNLFSISDLPKSMRKLELKMAKGNIPFRNINLFRDYKFSTEKLINGLIYKYGPEKANKCYEQISVIVSTECQEAYDLAFTEDSPFGQKMLNDIRERLRNRLSKDAASFFGCKYEHLLGFVAILTELCEVWWSDEFVIPEDADI